jgi:hypothetical protein
LAEGVRWQVIEPFPSLHPLGSGIHQEPTSREVLNKREDRFLEAKAISNPDVRRRGELSVEELAPFLEAMGEKIIWPED